MVSGEIQETELFNTSSPSNTSIMNDNLTTTLLHDILRTALNITSGNNSTQDVVVLTNDTVVGEEQGKLRTLYHTAITSQISSRFTFFFSYEISGR